MQLFWNRKIRETCRRAGTGACSSLHMQGGFWTSETLKRRLPDIVIPFDPTAVASCGYELTVGEESFVSDDEAEKKFLKPRETIIIPPGQVALMITNETIKAPLDALGFLSFKFGVKLKGLINVSGFHVDPGFEGKLVFSVYNAGVQNIHISVGSRLFLIWFCSLDGATEFSYSGTHKFQSQLPDDAVTNLAARMPSPFRLEKEIEQLRNTLGSEIDKMQRTLQLFITIAGSLFVGLFVLSIRGCFHNSSESESSKVSAPIVNNQVSPAPKTTTPPALSPKATP